MPKGTCQLNCENRSRTPTLALPPPHTHTHMHPRNTPPHTHTHKQTHTDTQWHTHTHKRGLKLSLKSIIIESLSNNYSWFDERDKIIYLEIKFFSLFYFKLYRLVTPHFGRYVPRQSEKWVLRSELERENAGLRSRLEREIYGGSPDAFLNGYYRSVCLHAHYFILHFVGDGGGGDGFKFSPPQKKILRLN